MEELKHPEDLDSLKGRILEKYQSEGKSEEILDMVERWKEALLFEANEGDNTMKERIVAEIDILDLYSNLWVSKEETIKDLEELKISAIGEGLSELSEEIDRKIEALKQ